ncbi:Thioesterase/thiol ester dehydrase-isomerase [Thelephora ganbajun]|uniref:Thioesterase/thiol ester dehydrase-isomerase n=1 Tax=Thelephora ganbajun TaxID=370292 RepID=A0ACB6ZDL3_THEGA|nr:Thioesterase/thiol ester dehydrase-isomerase [Thelephora ganbajun]
MDYKLTEPAQISTLLDIENLDVNLYRSKKVILPPNSRGVFGGLVISHAMVAATESVKPEFHLHVRHVAGSERSPANSLPAQSLHCYFILNASPATPIYYNVDRVRDGRSYVTRAVRAVQSGRVIFIMVCSYQKPEPWQPSYRSPMPSNVPPPEECKDEASLYRERAAVANNEYLKNLWIRSAEYRDRSPIAIRSAGDHYEGGVLVSYAWMKAKHVPECDLAYQKCILGYLSDALFIGAGSRLLGLEWQTEDGPKSHGLSSTLDHSIWFYTDNFDCGDWLLFETRAPQAGSGRALVHRRVFTRDGVLIAHFSQEGVVRARVFSPEKSGQTQSKL